MFINRHINRIADQAGLGFFGEKESDTSHSPQIASCHKYFSPVHGIKQLPEKVLSLLCSRFIIIIIIIIIIFVMLLLLSLLLFNLKTLS